MAYGEKYYVIYCDRNKKQFRLAIHQWDYTGPSIRHTAAPIPFAKHQETSSEIKQGGIYPTSATVTLVSSKTFNMEELYTADERTYLVTHEPTDGSDEGKWYGNIIPNGFTEEMDNDVHYMVLTASDNLPTLSLKLFEESPGINYGSENSVIYGEFEQSFLWVAKEALEKTGFLLPIWTMVDIKPRLPGSALVISKYVRAVSPSTVEFADDDGAIGDMLEQGARITIDWGDGTSNVYTADTWTGYDLWPNWMISITVDEAVSTRAGNATVSISNPSDTSTLQDPLAITVHDIRVYVRDSDIEGRNYFEVEGAAMTTWDVLNNLAKQWNARIYQNNGRWEIVRWNAHKINAGDYDYFVYNSEGVEIGREPFGKDVTYACKATRSTFRPFGHPISMDRVLGAVGVNYRYKFKQDGDSLANLIRNGNFAYTPDPGVPPPTTNPLEFAPQEWQRGSQLPTPPPVFLPLMSIEPVYWPSTFPWPIPQLFPPGINSFIKINGFYHERLWLSSNTGYPTNVNSGDELRISWWQRVPLQHTLSGTRFYGTSVIRVSIIDADGMLLYSLVNAGSETNSPTTNIETAAKWHQYNNDGVFVAFVSNAPGGDPESDGMSSWGQVTITTPPVPVNGRVAVQIFGTGASTVNAAISDPDRLPYSFSVYMPSPGGGTQLGRWPFVGRPLWITGIFVAKIVDPSNELVAQIHPYWYQNDGSYTDNIPDIEVLTGDDDDPDHVSNIYVMDGGTRRAIKAWDTWANDFGWGALGLILAKSIMELYYRPWRVIDGDFVAEHIDWATRFHFEERPGERYVILRGTIDPINNRFSGTLAQIYDEATPELPGGGNDGGGTVDPNWQPTGTVRCVRDGSGENTGEQERLEVDMNPASQTYGQQRWVNIGENEDACPIGEPIDLFWGASVLPIDWQTLEYFPYEKDGNDYLVRFDNDGTGKYLTFLHRASLGTVTSIRYQNGGWQAYGNLPSWEYQADTTINGYTYKVMRQVYMSGVLNQLPLIFTIE